jgi:plasmid maintenance system antidote protein VapI
LTSKVQRGLASQPLSKALYEWASKLTAESTGESITQEYYWTPEAKRILTKLKLTKRGLIGVLGVQGAGKSAAMRSLLDEIGGNDGFDWNHIIAVKVAETGGLRDAFRSQFYDTYYDQVEALVKGEIEERFSSDHVFLHKAERLAIRMGDEKMHTQVRWLYRGGGEVKRVCDGLRNMLPRHVIHQLEEDALTTLIDRQRLILIDMPDYPKHDRRLIARDLDEIQGLWNRLMSHPDVGKTDVTIVVFIQQETFDRADHFLYGKMDLISLMPLTASQLLEAYARKWGSYEPFNEDALQYIGKMSRGVFRRFKRYIGLAVELWMSQNDEAERKIDLERVKEAVTDEEIMRDIDKEFDGIFKKQDHKQKGLLLIRLLTEEKASRERSKATGIQRLSDFTHSGNPEPEGMNQTDLAEKLGLTEMEFSRLVRELEQHGYVKRTPWQQWKYVDLNW